MHRANLDHLHDLVSRFAPITMRAMFGGHGVYRDGAILGIVIDDALYLKVAHRRDDRLRHTRC